MALNGSPQPASLIIVCSLEIWIHRNCLFHFHFLFENWIEQSEKWVNQFKRPSYFSFYHMPSLFHMTFWYRSVRRLFRRSARHPNPRTPELFISYPFLLCSATRPHGLSTSGAPIRPGRIFSSPAGRRSTRETLEAQAELHSEIAGRHQHSPPQTQTVKVRRSVSVLYCDCVGVIICVFVVSTAVPPSILIPNSNNLIKPFCKFTKKF